MREEISTLKNLLTQATETINSLIVSINAEIKTHLLTIKQAKVGLKSANEDLELVGEMVGETADTLQDIAVGTMDFVEKVDDYLDYHYEHSMEEEELLDLVEPDIEEPDTEEEEEDTEEDLVEIAVD